MRAIVLFIAACLPVFAQGQIACTANLLGDAGFEDGLGEVFWSISTTAGNTVLQQNAGQARSGEWTAVMGGQVGTTDFTTLRQSVIIPTGKKVTLQFFLKHPLHSANGVDHMDLLIDGVAQVSFADADNVGTSYLVFDRDLSDLSDGLEHVFQMQSITTGAPSASVWILDDFCLNITDVVEGEGEGEGEGAGEGEGEGEGASEGEGEGQIDPEGENCDTLDQVAFTEPLDGSTIYLGASAGATAINLLAEVDCANDTKSVEFRVKRPSDSAEQTLSTDTAAPFTGSLQSVLAASTAQQYAFRAIATRASDDTKTVEATATVNIVQAGTAQDADSNALPDAPLSVLDAPGDRWLSTGSFSGATAGLIAAAYVMYGSSSETSPATAVSLAPPGGGGQQVKVEFPAGLVLNREVGIFVVAAATDLESLVGSAEEGNFAREPSGVLGEDAVYVAASLLIASNGGNTYAQAPDSRLAASPIKITMTGVPQETGKTYSVALHPAAVKASNGSAKILHSTGVWTGLDTQTADASNSTLTGELTGFGVAAPYYLVDTTGGGGCVGSGCPPNALWIELLIGLAVAILKFVDGGVGGGNGPCFIATAAYGTPLAHQIDTLRDFRDAALLSNGPGTALVDLYYRVSPPLADLVAQSPLLAALTRVVLLPVILAVRLVMAVPGWALLLCALGLASRRYAARKSKGF